MSDILMPHQEGMVSRGTSVLDANGFIKKHELRLGQANTLQGFDEDFAFFTPAILYLHGGFRDSPLADLILMTGTDVNFYYRKFNRPIFRGLEARSNGDPAWNFVLWAVRREHWQTVADWLVSITLTYSETGEVAGIGEQPLQIVDPLAVDRVVFYANKLPTLSISAFGLNGSRFRSYFKPGDNMLMDQPSLVFDRPAEEMQVFASALYGGGNPVDAKAFHVWQKKLKEEATHEG